jgi:predicted N-acetyltransferase YhbS
MLGLRLEMYGVESSVNAYPLLAEPPTMTTTLPVVAPVGTVAVTTVLFQLVGVASVPLNVTVLAPIVDPKFDPVIVTY